jgi:hypothetical protein
VQSLCRDSYRARESCLEKDCTLSIASRLSIQCEVL